MKVVIASENPGKIAEITSILESADIELVARPKWIPEVLEDAPDLVGNARLKAVAISDATGEVALADDTGLEVDALGGLPGVHSARYAGIDAGSTENTAKLLAELERVGANSPSQRAARFRTVMLVVHPDGTEVIAEGTVEGVIAPSPRGDGGFGYDPVFVPSEADGRTFAEMAADEKHAISHRGRALRELVKKLNTTRLH